MVPVAQNLPNPREIVADHDDLSPLETRARASPSNTLNLLQVCKSNQINRQNFTIL